VLQPFPDAGFESVRGGIVILPPAFQAALRHEAALEVMWIQIPFPVAELLRSASSTATQARLLFGAVAR